MSLELSTAFIIFSLSLDSLFSGLSYGVKKIKISFLCSLIFALISGTIFTTSSCLSSLFLSFLNVRLVKLLGGITLIVLGLYKSIEPVIKKIISKYKVKKSLKHHLALGHILNICDSHIETNSDQSSSLSIVEIIPLSFALNIDSLISGLAIDIKYNSWYLLALLSFTTNLISLLGGNFVGNKIGHHLKYDLSYLSGVLLIVVGIQSLF